MLFSFSCALYFATCTSISFAQKKQSAVIHKTLSSVTINGIKYYLHTVEKGQTLFAIAKLYDRDISDILMDNPEAVDGIKPEEVLKIQVMKLKTHRLAAQDTSCCILHKVEKGQTLYSISKQYNVSVEKLTAMNPELKDGLKVNQLLKIKSIQPKAEATSALVVAKKSESNKTITTDKGTIIINAKSSATTVDEKPSSFERFSYKGQKKSTYNIAFFLPFHAAEANAIDVEKIIAGDVLLPHKTNIALQFYEGALLAIDSLKKLKLNANVFIYDIDDNDSIAIFAALKKPELATMDLIIGPLYGSSFMPIANFAKEHAIAIVSPFTQGNKILFNNPFVSKVSPSATLQVEQMARFVVDSFPTQNIVLINNLNVKEAPLFKAFKATANAQFLKSGHAAADSIKESGIGSVQNVLRKDKINVVVFPSNNQSVVTDFISKLNALRDNYKIVLFGLPGWINYDNLDFEYLTNLSLHIPSSVFVDYKNSATQSFVNKYRDAYKTEPGIYTFQGFDVSYCFLSLLLKNGNGFLKTIEGYYYQGISSKYYFSQPMSTSGFENKFVNILEYQDYQLMRAN